MRRRINKAYQYGTHRAISPEITLAQTEALARAAGITRVANITGLDKLGVPVVAVYRPGSLSLVVSQGKGLSLAAAKASGVMESLEIWAAEQAPHNKVWMSFERLIQSQNALDPYTLSLSRVGAYQPAKQLCWVPGNSLISGKKLWVPLALVSTDYTVPYDRGTEAFCMSTNGLASGNLREESIVHALCELIERDASTLWSLLPTSQRNACRLDLDSIPDRHIRELINQYQGAGCALGVWSITSDIGVPVFRCELIEIGDKRKAPFYLPPSAGTGCHLSREIALIRAMCEAAQSRLTAISGAREDLLPECFDVTSESRMRKIFQISQLPSNSIKFCDIDSCHNETFEEDICWIIEKLNKVGIKEAVIVDLERTRETEVFVVRALVPHLEMDSRHPVYSPSSRALKVQSTLV